RGALGIGLRYRSGADRDSLRSASLRLFVAGLSRPTAAGFRACGECGRHRYDLAVVCCRAAPGALSRRAVRRSLSCMSEAEGGRIFFSSKGRTLEGEDEIVILSVGVDIGSSTSHLVFSRIV